MNKYIVSLLFTLFFSLCDLTKGEIDLNLPPRNNTNVFQTGQVGAIEVRGRLTSSKLPIVKYVVYASETGDFKDSKPVLELPDFFVSQSKVVSGFKTPVTNKIFVKRVSDLDEIEELKEEDNVEFKVKTDPYVIRKWKWFGVSSNYGGAQVSMGQILGENIRSKLPSDFVYDDYGNIKTSINGKEYYYQTAKIVRFFSIQNGICQVEDINNSYFEREDTLQDSQKIIEIEELLRNGIPISPYFAILVHVL